MYSLRANWQRSRLEYSLEGNSLQLVDYCEAGARKSKTSQSQSQSRSPPHFDVKMFRCFDAHLC